MTSLVFEDSSETVLESLVDAVVEVPYLALTTKKQLFGALISHLSKSNPKEMDTVLQDIYKNFIEPAFTGTTEAKTELEKFYKLPPDATDKQVREALENVDFENIGIS